ncbi:LysR family transcriptional regulator substrate-binding protein [Streptomyces sp. NPDC050485]|uniref:LysR family transcriptional regulator substrate-binding protein n=1 Tax=Streptomyces sp. NPDC050485 TaxID=3365617 RepID=UPI0037BA1DCC
MRGLRGERLGAGRNIRHETHPTGHTAPHLESPPDKIRRTPRAGALDRAERTLAELDDARREMADAAGAGPGRVTVAAEALLQPARVLAAFRVHRPGAGVRLFQAPVDSMRRHLRSAEVDFALASQPLAGPELCSLEWCGRRCCRPCRPGARSGGRAGGEDFVGTPARHWQRALLERLFAREGTSPRVVCEGDEAAATPELIGAGLGVGLARLRQAVKALGPVLYGYYGQAEASTYPKWPPGTTS